MTSTDTASTHTASPHTSARRRRRHIAASAAPTPVGDIHDFAGFRPSLRRFLRELAAENSRDWFDENRERFEREVREPVEEFIRAVRPRLHRISPHLLVDDSRTRGSLMRMNRDTRFSADKRPYHQSVVVRFPHTQADAGWAPGYTLRISAREFVLGAGMRVAGAHTLSRLREAIDSRPDDWAAVVDDASFEIFYGGFPEPALKRVPKPYAPDHPFADDLRRRDFRVYRTLRVGTAATAEFLDEVEATFVAGEPLLAFLCEALGIPWKEP